VLGVLLLAANAASAAVAVPPRPDRYATDRAGVTDAARLSALNEALAQFERDTSNQVLVYVDRRLPEGTDVEEYVNAAFQAWAVGQKGRDNGVVFFAFVDDRKMRIEVGYGLEAAIPDARSKQILDLVVTPRFRQGDVTGGVEEAAREIMKAARGEAFPGTGRTVAESGLSGPLPQWLWVIPFLAGLVGWRVSRDGSTVFERLARGGGTWAAVTAILSMLSVFLTGDIRPMALGFGVVLVFLAGAVAVLIGKDDVLTGRRWLGLTLLRAGAGLFVGSWGLLAMGVASQTLAGLGFLALLGGPIALVVGGFLRSDDPLQNLTIAVARIAFVLFALSSVFLAFVFTTDRVLREPTLDWVVVSGIVWIASWVFAHSRGWKLTPESGPSGGGGYSRSGSGSGSSSSYSSSSSSSSSYSGGGGRSGGGGASGSW